ncbi:MAG: hypothetical protein M3014_06215 [Chloroflexota bacterium]|nr:hypothetical protein [Chloroflexota bacterium]
MYVMRFTVIDQVGTVSFVAPCTALKALVAACARMPDNIEDLLSASTGYDSDLKSYVLNGIAVFDEHNSHGSYEQIHNALDFAGEQKAHHQVPAFRVVDEVTREASLESVQAGLVIFNLKERRIVQVHNTYADVKRQDRGRIHRGGEPTDSLYSYNLPPDWQIVP